MAKKAKTMASPNISLANMKTAEHKAAEAQAEMLARFWSAIQSLLDGTAKERMYDSIQTAVSYVGDDNPTFDAEAVALKAWRSAVWTYSTAQLEMVLAGQRPAPTVEEFLAEIGQACPFAWPE